MGLGLKQVGEKLGAQFSNALKKTSETIGNSCDFTYNTMFARQNVARAQMKYDKALEGIKFVPNDPSPPETFDPQSDEGIAFIQEKADKLEEAVEIAADSAAKWEKVYDWFSDDGTSYNEKDNDGASPS